MIRIAVLAAVVVGAASPALAMSSTTVAAPKGSAASFIHTDSVMRLAPAGASEAFHMGPHEAGRGQTVIYELPKGKPAAVVDVTNPRDNPFMMQPERTPAPAR